MVLCGTQSLEQEKQPPGLRSWVELGVPCQTCDPVADASVLSSKL